MQGENITVSVIIPVYNVEAYLPECLDSAVGQTLRNIEIICVDDGSTDHSPAILADYQKKDSRMKVLRQQNMGLSAARNSGLRCARGKYIYFLDGDDYVDREMLQTTVQLAEEKDLDAVVFNFVRFADSEELLKAHPFYVNSIDGIPQVYTGIEYLKVANECGAYSVSAWKALWRHQFLEENQLRFKEGILYEDMLFSFYAYMAAKRVMQIPNRFYHYRVRPGSITMMAISSQNVRGSFESAKGVLKYALQNCHEPVAGHEVWRAYRSYSEHTYHLYTSLAADRQKAFALPEETDYELFRQMMALFQVDSLQSERSIQQEEIEKMRNEVSVQNETLIKLQNDLDEWREQYRKLQDTLNANKEEAGCLQAAIEKIQSSWSFRTGRVITWLPRMIRDTVRSFRGK